MAALVPWQSFPPNTRVPGTDYIAQWRLGQGGMGDVYAVRHMLTGEWRAMKVLSPYVARRRDLARRLVLEGQILSTIRAPHLVRVYEVEVLDDGRPYFVMDLLEGETLHAALARGPLPPERACGFVYQTLGALAHVHRANLVHRDVKPANLFVRASDGVCVLLDFGLVKLLTEGGPFHYWHVTTREGLRLGTARYVPPEVSQGTRPDERADVYAAGVVLAELLAGELPLAALGESDYLAHIDAHGFEVPEGLHPELRRVIAWATRSNPDERLPSAERFAAELGWACQRAGIDLAGTRPELPPPLPPARLRRVISVLPAALVGGLGWGAAAALAAGWCLSAPAVERVSPESRATVGAVASPLRPAAVSTLHLAAVAPTVDLTADPTADPTADLWWAPPPSPSQSVKASAGPSATKQRAALEAKRASLEAALRDGRGSLAAIRSLRRVCRELGDKDCHDQADVYLDQLLGPP